MLLLSLSLSQSDYTTHKFSNYIQEIVNKYPRFKERLSILLTFEERLPDIKKNLNIDKDLADERKIIYYYYYATRYPNYWDGCGCDVEYCIPDDHYDQRDVKLVLHLANAVIDVMDEILSQHELVIPYN